MEGSHGKRENIPADRVYYITSGQGMFTVNGQKVSVTEGVIVALEAGSTYDFKSIGGSMKFFVDVGVKLDLDEIPS